MCFPTSHQPRFQAAPNFLKLGIKYLNLSSFGQFRQYFQMPLSWPLDGCLSVISHCWLVLVCAAVVNRLQSFVCLRCGLTLTNCEQNVGQTGTVCVCVCVCRLGMYRDAEKQFKSAIADQPMIDSFLYLAKVYIRLDQPLAAIDVYKQGLIKFPQEVSLLLGEARLQEV